MTIPTVTAIVVPLPSLGHRQICVAGLARDTPDSGEAAIMGVPLPHLVLPTPTRATRGEARGHRSALAQNSLLMYPLLFPSFGFVVGLVCRRHMVDWPQCVVAAVVALLFGFVRWRYFVDMWVAEGHTARWSWLCVLFVQRLTVWVQTGAGHAHTVAMWGFGAQQLSMVSRPSLGTLVLRGCVWQSRPSGPHWLPQMIGEGLEDEGAFRSYNLVYLCRCGGRPLRPEGWYSMATHPSDP